MKKLIIFFLICISFVIYSQEKRTDSAIDISSILLDMERNPNDSLGFDMSTIDNIAAFNKIFGDSLLIKKTTEALVAYCDYQVFGLDHRERTFEWQYFSTKLIFFCVILLVVAGIVFSGIQFRKGLKEGKPEVTTAEVSPTGLKFSSSVLGVIILFISLLFFYLYLMYVYPISEIF